MYTLSQGKKHKKQHCDLSEKENRNEKGVAGRRMVEGTAEI